uniref:Uncharacterized protein n=1 Tax=Arundo donax TaxID=35708 RepID=A0A0A9HCY1_ARUDO
MLQVLTLESQRLTGFVFFKVYTVDMNSRCVSKKKINITSNK